MHDTQDYSGTRIENLGHVSGTLCAFRQNKQFKLCIMQDILKHSLHAINKKS